MALKRLTKDEYFNGVISSNRSLLSKSITLIESTLAEDIILAKDLIQSILPYSGKSFRLGISGVPGVGKSSFIELFGKMLVDNGKRLAILTIDPSSNRTSGSILGDKTRMSQLAVLPEVYIRPSPSSNILGGVGRCTAETILLCEAAGFDFIIIETVGVGQSEIQVKNLVDFFMVMLLPGGGDDLQGIKKGIIEEADLIVINKAEESNMLSALESKSHYQAAIQMNNDEKKVILSSVKSKLGMDEVLAEVLNVEVYLNENNHKSINRQQQKVLRLKSELSRRLEDLFFSIPNIKEHWALIEVRILENELTVEQGLDELISYFN
jgi:LAO/AO transport system kinase